ncbi:MAG: IS1 family transposase [Gammaproteobacteria bacterium]|nr:IS1 family transposase [Gammaproteobacteria bacterium]
MNALPRNRRILILKCLTEGMSMRATARIADVSRQTVNKLLIDAGKACAAYQHETLRDLPCRRLEVDEIWEFVCAKERNVLRAKSAPREAGDVWTWVAICAETKIVPSWLVGDRTDATAIEFMDDLRGRLANRVQLSSVGHKAYLEAVEGAFGSDVDYAQIIKLYGKAPGVDDETRYSPAVCTNIEKHRVEGNPDMRLGNTSYAERQNLTMRMSMRRFTRLTNSFSKKVENHFHAMALHFMHYNFCRLHQTLRITPAMAAGVTGKLWEMGDIVDLIDVYAPAPKKPGPKPGTKYKPRQKTD